MDDTTAHDCPEPIEQPVSRRRLLAGGAAAGADVLACDIADRDAIDLDYPLGTGEQLEHTARLVRSTGRRCLPLKADVRRPRQMQVLAERAVTELGGLHIAVANAGVVSYHPLAELSPRRWQDVIDVNLTGVANTMRAVVPHLVGQRSGAIVAVSSTEGRHGAPALTHYCAAKWGVIGLIKALATEIGPAGVRVTGVAPTGVATAPTLNDATYAWAGGDGP